jgi:hypothetical protein
MAAGCRYIAPPRAVQKTPLPIDTPLLRVKSPYGSTVLAFNKNMPQYQMEN